MLRLTQLLRAAPKRRRWFARIDASDKEAKKSLISVQQVIAPLIERTRIENSIYRDVLHPLHRELVACGSSRSRTPKVRRAAMEVILRDYLRYFVARCERTLRGESAKDLRYSSGSGSDDASAVALHAERPLALAPPCTSAPSSVITDTPETDTRPPLDVSALTDRERMLLRYFNFNTMLFPDETSVRAIRNFCASPPRSQQGSKAFFFLFNRHHRSAPASHLNTHDVESLLAQMQLEVKLDVAAARGGAVAPRETKAARGDHAMHQKRERRALWHCGQHRAIMELRRTAMRTEPRFGGDQNASRMINWPPVDFHAQHEHVDDLRRELVAEQKLRRALQRAFWQQPHVRTLFSPQRNRFNEVKRPSKGAEDDSVATTAAAAGEARQQIATSAAGLPVAQNSRDAADAIASDEAGTQQTPASPRRGLRHLCEYWNRPVDAIVAVNGQSLYRKYLIHAEVTSPVPRSIGSHVNGGPWTRWVQERMTRAELSLSDAATAFGRLSRMQQLAFKFCFPASLRTLYDPQQAFEAFALFHLVSKGVLRIHPTPSPHFYSAAERPTNAAASASSIDAHDQMSLRQRQRERRHTMAMISQRWTQTSPEVEVQWELVGSILAELRRHGRSSLTFASDTPVDPDVREMLQLVSERPARLATLFSLKHHFRTPVATTFSARSVVAPTAPKLHLAKESRASKRFERKHTAAWLRKAAAKNANAPSKRHASATKRK